MSATPKIENQELSSMKLRWAAVSEAANKAVTDLKEVAHELLLLTGEVLQSKAAMSAVARADPLILKYSKSDFQRRVMRAIIYEEQVHALPPFIEDDLEQLGFGDSLGLSQIKESWWAQRYGSNRKELNSDEGNIRVMQAHLQHIESIATQRGLPITIQVMGSLWNKLHATKVTPYGLRVKRFDRMLNRAALTPPAKKKIPAKAAETRRAVNPRTTIEARIADSVKREEHRKKIKNRGAPQRVGIPSVDHPRDFDKPRLNRPGFRVGEPKAPAPTPRPRPAPAPRRPEKNINELPRKDDPPVRVRLT